MRRLAVVCLSALFALGCRNVPRLAFQRLAPATAATTPAVIEEDANVHRLATGAWESTIAISPANPNIVLATAMRWSGPSGFLCDIHRSEDGGRTWTNNGPLPLQTQFNTYGDQGDPVLIFDRTGTAYCSILMRYPNPSKPAKSALAVMKSTDDGRTWQAIGLTSREAVNGRLPIFDDKEWIAVDNSGGPNDGTLYIAWIRANGYNDATNYDMVFSRSTDGGQTWSEPQIVAPKSSVAFLQVGADGTVYFSHSGGIGFVMKRSTDGGETWSSAWNVARMSIPSTTPANLQYNPLTVLQQFAVDQSNTVSRGNLYFVYPGRGAAAGQLPASVHFTRSTDGGQTWSEPLRLSMPPAAGRDALFPTVASDPITGDLLLAWVDRRDDEKNTLARLFVSRSRDGGATFEPPLAVTTPFSIDAGFMGHYNGLAGYGETRVAVVSDAAGNLSAVRLSWAPPPPPTPRRRVVRP